MAEVLYTIDILRLAASTAEWPALTDPQGSVERRSPTCGSRIRVDVTCDKTGALASIGVGVNACALGQAATAILARSAPGKDARALHATRDALAAYLSGESDNLPDWPNIAHLAPARAYPARHASILLPFDAVAAAMDAAEATSVPDRAHG